jgi:hypothetical protein
MIELKGRKIMRIINDNICYAIIDYKNKETEEI